MTLERRWKDALTDNELAFVFRCCIIVSNATPVEPPAQWVSIIEKLAGLLNEMQEALGATGETTKT